MTTKDEMKISNEVVQSLIMRLKLAGIDYYAMPPAIRNHVILGFQAGVEYWQGKIEERQEKIDEMIGNKLKDLDIDDIPF